MKVLGIDIGGSGIKGAVVNVTSGRLITPRLREDTPETGRPVAIARAVAKLVNRFGWKGPVGIGFPGIVRRHVAITAANLHPTWSGIDLARHFSRATKCPIHVLNDADAAGLGEVAFGAGRRHSGTVVMLTFGTGIGSALIRDGVLIPNLEFGHLKFKHTITEKYASASVRKNEDLSWREWSCRVNEVLQHIQLLISPDLFIIGGGVSSKFERFASYLDVPVKVVPARLQNHAGIVGAALAAARHLPKQKLKVKRFVPLNSEASDEGD